MEALLAALAIAIGAPAHVQVQCLEPAAFDRQRVTDGVSKDAYAYAYGPNIARIVLQAGTCRTVVYPHTRKNGRVAFQTTVFAHEVAHTRGITDEHVATCDGYQQTRQILMLQGMSKQRATQVRRVAKLTARWDFAETHVCMRLLGKGVATAAS